MDERELLDRLDAGEIVVLDQTDWESLSPAFELVEEHDTHMSGMLRLVRHPGGLAAVEQPSPGQRTIRPMPDMDTARSFVAERLNTYDRMWDGCGCKVDYLH